MRAKRLCGFGAWPLQWVLAATPLASLSEFETSREDSRSRYLLLARGLPRLRRRAYGLDPTSATGFLRKVSLCAERGKKSTMQWFAHFAPDLIGSRLTLAGEAVSGEVQVAVWTGRRKGQGDESPCFTGCVVGNRALGYLAPGSCLLVAAEGLHTVPRDRPFPQYHMVVRPGCAQAMS